MASPAVFCTAARQKPGWQPFSFAFSDTYAHAREAAAKCERSGAWHAHLEYKTAQNPAKCAIFDSLRGQKP
jgi:hypothetical protein